jgi:predicted XRE-type DNA-binding protein
MQAKNKHAGSSFDAFLEKEGLSEVVNTEKNMVKTTSAAALSKKLKISKSRAQEAIHKAKVAKNTKEIGQLLGLSDADVALMKYKADLTSLAVKRLDASKLSLNEIVKLSGVSRSKVSAVKNGATVSVSCDLLIKIIAATGAELVAPRAA